MIVSDTSRKELVCDRFDKEPELWKSMHEDPMRNMIAWEVARRKQITRDALVERFAGQPIRILEIGCGAGENLKLILGADPHWSCKGVDISPKMIEYCREHFADESRVSFDVLDVEDRPLDEQFDAIALLGVVGYFDSTARAMAHVNAMLKPGGLLVFTFGKKLSISRGINRIYGTLRCSALMRPVYKLAGRQAPRHDDAPSHFRSVTDHEIRAAMPDSLEVRRVHHIVFAANVLKSVSVWIGRVLECLFERADPFRLSMTGVIVAEKIKAASPVPEQEHSP